MAMKYQIAVIALIIGIFVVSGCVQCNKLMGKWHASGPLGLDVDLNIPDDHTIITSSSILGSETSEYKILDSSYMKLIGADCSTSIIKYDLAGNDILTLYLTESNSITFQRVESVPCVSSSGTYNCPIEMGTVYNNASLVGNWAATLSYKSTPEIITFTADNHACFNNPIDGKREFIYEMVDFSTLKLTRINSDRHDYQYMAFEVLPDNTGLKLPSYSQAVVWQPTSSSCID